MNVYSINTLSGRDFALALRDELWARGLTALTAGVRAGKEAYRKLVRREPDGPRTVLPGTGWIGLELDEGMDDWEGMIVGRER